MGYVTSYPRKESYMYIGLGALLLIIIIIILVT